jgi:GntR family transcriptional regulator
MIDPRSPVSVYQQLANLLRDAIHRGEYGPGELLPSEGRLGQMYEVGRDTVRDALAVLRGEGLVVTAKGAGTRVRSNREMRVVVIGPEDEVTGRMPTPAERERLDIPVGVPVFVVTRPGGRESELWPADRVILRGAGE